MSRRISHMIRERILNVAVLILILATGSLAVYCWRLGVFDDLATLRAYIDSAGWFAPLAFVLLHLLQILLPFIPGGILLTAGVIIFGPWYGLLYNYVGIITGSAISFGLARKYGYTFVRNKISPALWHKYMRWLDNEKLFCRTFMLLILLPFAPDDALCMLAGISQMSWRQFALIIMTLKLPILSVYSISMLTAESLI